MIASVNVTNAAAKIIDSGLRDALIFENESDATVFYAIGAGNGATLTAANGLRLKPGDQVLLTGVLSGHAIYALHGAAGNKVVNYQTV